MSISAPISRHMVTRFALVLSLLGLTACQSSGLFSGESSEKHSLASEYHGLWQSNGYGYLIDAHQLPVKAYHITPDVCVQDDEVGDAFYGYANQQIEGGRLVATVDGKQLYLSEPFEDYRIQFNRLDDLPAKCSVSVVNKKSANKKSVNAEIANTPMANFQAFTSYMTTHYAFFDLYKVNWSQVVADHQDKVTDDMSDEALFDLFSTMLEPLKDAHLSLQATINGDEKTYRPEISPVGEATKKLAEKLNTSKKKIDRKLFDRYWINGIREDILQDKGVIATNDLIQYGVLSKGAGSKGIESKYSDAKNIGYMAIAATYNYANLGINYAAEDRQQLTATLDNAFTLFNQQAVTAVILDLSINFGGHSFPATDIAARFAEKSTSTFSKQAYDASGLEASPIQITTSQRPHFHGPVYLLASSVTVSGGEEVVLALKALPNVTLMGERTRGALSDILDKKLPNGWSLAISNEIYTDENGQLWEGDGIQPDIEIPVFDSENPFKGHLDAVDQVIQIIRQQALENN